VDAAIEGGVGAQITTNLDAGIGARNEPEACAIERTDFYVLDRLGLDRKIGCLALQLPFLRVSESMGNHDSKIVGAGSVD
jgi:hypothetical protein